MVDIRLDEAISQITTKIKDKITVETNEGGLLEEIESVRLGDRSKPSPEPPVVWIMPDTAHIFQETSLVETWALPIVLSVVYLERDDPELGYKNANRLAALARSVVIKDRRLGLPDFVQDVQSVAYIPSKSELRDGNLYGAGTIVNIHFRVTE